MRAHIIKAFALGLILLSSYARASWLSEITGIDIDLNRGRVEVKPPNLAAIPQMIQNLPKDVGQAMLNPAAPALATAIRFSRGQALNRGTQPIPPSVQQMLAPYFSQGILSRVRWTTADGISLDGALKNWFDQEGAITYDDVIVFSSAGLTNDVELWAHELTHVLQYSQMGVETFAFFYTFNFDSMEAQARQNASRVISSIRATQSGQGQTWAFASTAMPSTGQLKWSSVSQAARQTINPIQCIWIDNQMNMTGNECPVPIRVTGIVLQRLFDGHRFTFPCNEPTCLFPPGASGPLLSPPGHLVIGVTAAYRL
jgi:Domain of unknown function (DUF4157)